jgi:hypothetical protein
VIHVNILTDPFTTQNTRAFLTPLLRAESFLRDSGVRLKFHYDISSALSECDILAINSNYFWNFSGVANQDGELKCLDGFKGKVDQLLYFDRSSTPTSLNVDVLYRVDRYYKTSLLKDRTQYGRPQYGGRVFAEYYHQTRGIEDKGPTYSATVQDTSLKNVGLAWNTSMTNYSLLGPRLASFYRKLPLKFLLGPPWKFEPPSADRPQDVSCRISTNYRYDSVAYQRKEVAGILAAYCAADRVSKPAYFRELRNSRIVVSPFGYSELNYKDYETFICGSVLLKPDMSHIETYPNLYNEGETYVAHSWDLGDVLEKVEDILAHYDQYLEVARKGQETYRWHTATMAGLEEFSNRFLSILNVGSKGT